MKDKKLLERLEFLHSDMENIIEIMMQDGRPNKAVELSGSAMIIQEWIESIKKEGK